MRRWYPDEPSATIAQALDRTVAQIYGKAAKMGLRKSAAFLAGPMAGHLDGHRDNGRRFQKGNLPWSAGTKGVAGVHPNSRSTQFAKGKLTGRNAKSYIPIGGHRISTDGYVCRKVRDDGPPQHRFVPVHRLVWMQAHGEIPGGHVVVFRRGMKTVDPALVTVDRLELLTNAENLARNRLPPELQQIACLRGALTRAINKRTKEQSA
jgi:hypothetical protein